MADQGQPSAHQPDVELANMTGSASTAAGVAAQPATKADMAQQQQPLAVPVASVTPPKPRTGPRKSYQVRALVRKTLSYQWRQPYTNCCCIFLCPCLMVAISGILAIVVTGLISRLVTPNLFLYCSNVTSVDLNGDYILDTRNVSFYPSVNRVNQANYFSVIVDTFAASSRRRNTIDASGGNRPCVAALNRPYEYAGLPYEPNPIPAGSTPSPLDALRTRSSVMYTDPVGGWLDLSAGSFLRLSRLIQFQTYPWHLVVNNPNLPISGGIPFTPQFNPLTTSTATVDANYVSGKTGFYGGMGGTSGGTKPQFYFSLLNDTVPTFANGSINFAGLATAARLTPVPFLESFSGTDNDVDDKMLSYIDAAVAALTAAPNKAAISSNNAANRLAYTFSVASALRALPYGAIKFTSANVTGMQYSYDLFTGTDRRIARAGLGYPSQGLRQAMQVSEITQAAVLAANSSYQIVQTFRAMPQIFDSTLNIPIGGAIGQILYPFGVSFLLPIFVITLVKEKEDRILVMMRMNGLKTWAYYLSHFIHFYILHIITCIIFFVTGGVFRMTLFTLTQPGVYVVLFLLWGLVQISMAFFFATVFNKSRSALVTTFLLVLASIIINLVTNDIFITTAPTAYFIWPPFAFYRGLSVLNQASYTKGAPPYTFALLTGNDEVLTAMIALVIEIIVFAVVAIYLTLVFPSEYGVPRPWHFVVSEPYAWIRSIISRKKSTEEEKLSKYGEGSSSSPSAIPLQALTSGQYAGAHAGPENSTAELALHINAKELEHEDDDVKAERQRVYEGRFPADCPLVVLNMRKSYGDNYIACKSMTMAVEKDMIFGLLGPNGAGKTTLISILTGLYRPTSGDAWLAGYNVNTNMQDVYMNMGVCPQYDIHWDDLTVAEHLLFYSRLKGVPAHEEMDSVTRAIEAVGLRDFTNRLSKGLSGGEKRRLSIAIALVGDCPVLFFDEPTTGLDPEVRRLIWNIINSSRTGKSVILTTHSMEEAEVLCQRIGIMAKGTMRCIGPQIHLKNKYGSGFRLTIACHADRQDDAMSFAESLLPSGWEKSDDFTGNVSYDFALKDGVTVSSLFAALEAGKEKAGVTEWGLAQVSLESVFLNIIGESAAQAD